jgi:hypothetical protein
MVPTNQATGVAAFVVVTAATAAADVAGGVAPRIRARWRSSTPHPFPDLVPLRAV